MDLAFHLGHELWLAVNVKMEWGKYSQNLVLACQRVEVASDIEWFYGQLKV